MLIMLPRKISEKDAIAFCCHKIELAKFFIEATSKAIVLTILHVTAVRLGLFEKQVKIHLIVCFLALTTLL